MKGRFSDRQRIEHVLDAITEIEQYTQGQTLIEFSQDSMMRFACIKQIEIIGEACNHIDVSIREAFPEIEWRNIVGLRNLLIHEYFGVDTILIWDVITTNIPQLKEQLLLIIGTL